MDSIHDRRTAAWTGCFSLVTIVVAVYALSFVSCAAQPALAGQKLDATASVAHDPVLTASRREAARKVHFRVEAAIIPALPSSIGPVSSDVAARLSPTAHAALSAAFGDAYVDAAFRGIALEGALGGDRVHLWSSAKSGAYVQNWRSAKPVPNSWGLSALVLAAKPLDGDRVFVVQGAMLDAYGRGEGIGEANGIAGYGAPLSDEFTYEGGVAQRFELGLLVVAQDGGRRFLQEKHRSASAAPMEGIGSLGVAPPPGFTEGAVASAFRSAWTTAVDRGLLPAVADGPVRSITFPVTALHVAPMDASRKAVSSDPASHGTGGGASLNSFTQEEDAAPVRSEPVRVEAVLLQTYGDSAWALVLPVGQGTGRRVRLLEPPILDGLLAAGSWEAAFVAYGAPLSDPFPREGKTAQRFSAGWMETE